MYDIRKNKTRNNLAKFCLEMGMERVQLSVFVGDLERSSMDSIKIFADSTIDKEKDSVYIFPMSKDEFKDTVLLGQAFDKKMIQGDIHNLFM